jgi:hypothetical protein
MKKKVFFSGLIGILLVLDLFFAGCDTGTGGGSGTGGGDGTGSSDVLDSSGNPSSQKLVGTVWRCTVNDLTMTVTFTSNSTFRDEYSDETPTGSGTYTVSGKTIYFVGKKYTATGTITGDKLYWTEDGFYEFIRVK